MRGSIHEYARVGIVHFMLWKGCIRGEGDFSGVHTLLDDPYFDAIEVSWVKDARQRAELAAAIQRSGKTVAFGAQPVLLTGNLDLNSLDEGERRRAVAGVVETIPQAVELGARGFALLSGPDVPAPERGRATERLVQSLVEIGTELGRHSAMPLVLETFDRLSYAKNRLIGPNAEAALVAREVRKSIANFGLMIDLSHLPLQGETPAEAWATAGAYVVHAHMGNCVMNKPDHPLNGDEHVPFCHPAGENGVDELTTYLSVLHSNGYLDRVRRPILSFEVCRSGDLTEEAVIAHCKQTLDAAWRNV